MATPHSGVCVWNTCSPRSCLVWFLQGARRSHPSHANEAMDVDWMSSQTCEPVPAKSCSWVTCVTAWGLNRDCTFLFEDGKRLSHNPLNVLLLCVGKTEYHVIRVCPEGGLHECVCVCLCVCVRACVRACARACLRVCVSNHCKSFRLQWYLGHTWRYGSTILCWGHYTRQFCQLPWSQFLNLSYFTSKKEIPVHP